MNRWANRCFFGAGAAVCFSFLPLGFAATKLRIGYSAITTTQAPLWAAEDLGLFGKYGIEPGLIYLAGGS